MVNHSETFGKIVHSCYSTDSNLLPSNQVRQEHQVTQRESGIDDVIPSVFSSVLACWCVSKEHEEECRA